MTDFNVSEMAQQLVSKLMLCDAYPPELVNRAKRICENEAFGEFKIEYLRRLLNHEEID